MKQEKVKFGQLKQGTVFYWADPEANRYDVLPDYKDGDMEADPNADVWIVMLPWEKPEQFLKDKSSG